MQKKILELLEEVPDYRKGNAVRHKLVDILMIGLLTIICNGNEYTAMVLFGSVHEKILREFLELPHGIPSQDTFERVFSKLNPKVLSVLFKEWTDEMKGLIKNNITVAIDGKTIRRSKSNGKKAVHVVTAFAGELRLVLGQLATDKKSNEITAIPKLLDMFCQKGMIITIDAMGTQKDIAQKIIEKEGDYVLSLKENQKSLLGEVSLLLDEDAVMKDKKSLRENGRYEKTVEKGHGRIETRECFISRNVAQLENADKWVGLNGVGLIVSETEEIGKELKLNYEYFIFSPKDVTAADMLRIKRGHWAIENNLHWTLDVTFGEDDSRARSENAAENLNIFRKQALQLMQQETSVKGSMRSKRLRCSYDIFYAFKVIGVK